MIGSNNTWNALILQPAECPEHAIFRPVVLLGGVVYPQGQALGFVTGTGTAVNEIQTLTVTGTSSGGSFVLTFNGEATAAIAWDATAAVVAAALALLPSIGSGQVTGGGGPLPGTPVTLTFAGTLAGRKMPLVGVINSLTGTNPVLTPTASTPGKPAQGYFKNYDDGASDGSQVCRGFLREYAVTNPDGSVRSLADPGAIAPLTASMFINGLFRAADITGLDAAALVDLNGRIVGGSTTLSDANCVIAIGI